MIRDITIGQYYPSESIIHKLDPRTKIIGTIVFIVSLFLFDSFSGYLIVTAFLALCISLSKVPFSYMVRGLKAIVVLLLLTVIINMLMTPGETLFAIGKLTISKEGFRAAIFMGIRLIFLIIGSSIMTLTTSPNNLTDALESLMKPLKKFKAPVHEIAMMMSIALTFIPILIEETDKIMKAQMARGADFENKNIIKKVKSYVPVLVPLFISAFRRAGDLAMAMEARCYRGGDGRTKMKPLKYGKCDFVAFSAIVGYLVIAIVVSKLIYI